MRTSAIRLFSVTIFNNNSPQFLVRMTALLTRNSGSGREGYLPAEPTLLR